MCLGFESVMHDHVKMKVRGPIRAVQVNNGYRKLELLGLTERRALRRNLKTVEGKRSTSEKKLLGLRKETTTLLVDELGVREL